MGSNHPAQKPAPDRRLRIVAGFLAISYGVGATLTAYVEYTAAVLSQRFDLPPELIYLTCAVQLACVFGVLSHRFAPWAAAALTVITLGAIGSHLRMQSPVTALPAFFYAVVQVWFGFESRVNRADPSPREHVDGGPV